MKVKAIVLALMAAFTLSTNLSANDLSKEGPGKKYQQLRELVVQKVESIKEKFQWTNNENVDISFQIKDDGSLEIQSVICKNKKLQKFLMDNLDRQILDIDPNKYESGTDYWISLDYTVL